MKKIPEVIDRINELRENYMTSLEESTEQNPLYFKRQGALWALDELLKFINDDKWKAK